MRRLFTAEQAAAVGVTRAARGQSRSSVHETRAMLHRACRLARKWSASTLPNPVSDTELPEWKLAEPPAAQRCPSVDDVRATPAVAAAADLRLAAFIRVVAATGARRSGIVMSPWMATVSCSPLTQSSLRPRSRPAWVGRRCRWRATTPTGSTGRTSKRRRLRGGPARWRSPRDDLGVVNGDGCESDGSEGVVRLANNDDDRRIWAGQLLLSWRMAGLFGQDRQRPLPWWLPIS
jgi:hypothetical protein